MLLPNSVLFREGAGLGYYIEMAGGYAGDADKGRARVEFANGSVKTVSRFLFFKSSPEPGAGSRIFVPAKIPTKGINFAQFAAILGTVATTAILLTRK